MIVIVIAGFAGRDREEVKGEPPFGRVRWRVTRLRRIG